MASFGSNFSIGLTADDVKRIVWTAVLAFLAVFGTLSTGIGSWHNFSDAKSAILSLIPAALAAAGSAIKNGILADSSKLK